MVPTNLFSCSSRALHHISWESQSPAKHSSTLWSDGLWLSIQGSPITCTGLMSMMMLIVANIIMILIWDFHHKKVYYDD